MSNKKLYKFYIDVDDLEALEQIKATEGVPVAFSIRTGIKMVLAQRQLVDARVVWTPGAAPTTDGNE